MSLHAVNDPAHWRDPREQPSLAGTRARKPAGFSRADTCYWRRNGASGCWFRVSQLPPSMAVAEPGGSRWILGQASLCPYPVSEATGLAGRRFGRVGIAGACRPIPLNPIRNPDHGAGLLPRDAVMCATEALDALRTGPCRTSSPGRGHPFHHPRSRSAECNPSIVVHAAASISVEPAKPPSTVRLDRGSVAAPVRVSQHGHHGAFQWTRSVPPEANL